MAKISVIIPVYNEEKHLEECLNSIINQTLKDIEIIIINDCSTDNTKNIIDKYLLKYPNIKVINNEVNKGVGACRNIGISISKGDYISFIDSDDYIHPNMLLNMYNAAINTDSDIVETGIAFVQNTILKFADNSDMYETFEIKKNKDMLYWCSPSACNKLFKKELIKDLKFLENLMWEDVGFTFSAMILSNRIANVNSLNYFYRRDIKSGETAKGYKLNPNLFDIFKSVDQIEVTAKNNGLYEIYKEQIKFLQIAYSLQRVSEINEWNISDNDKKEIISYFYSIVNYKYGNLNTVNKDLLSSKIDIFSIDYDSINIINYEDSINKLERKINRR